MIDTDLATISTFGWFDTALPTQLLPVSTFGWFDQSITTPGTGVIPFTNDLICLFLYINQVLELDLDA
jgi:hypothetical protein